MTNSAGTHSFREDDKENTVDFPHIPELLSQKPEGRPPFLILPMSRELT